MKQETILVTGANGQIGTVLCEQLRKIYGETNVLATDIHAAEEQNSLYERLDITDKKRLHELIRQYQVTQVYHLAAILSVKGEQNPLFTWDLNMNGLFNVLEAAKETAIHKVFFPSSIAVFGDKTPVQQTPQDTVLNPSTVYGISKLSGELWCNYYFDQYQIDVRSLRYPGIISYQSLPGGGTTDYAVEIFHNAVKGEPFQCFLQEDTYLPMIYMPDAIKGTIDLMEAPAQSIKTRSSYNLSGMSFSPVELATEIQQHFPNFQVSYQPDFRQKIADSWSDSIDDSQAREDWGWKPQYNLKEMTTDMIINLRKKYEIKI